MSTPALGGECTSLIGQLRVQSDANTCRLAAQSHFMTLKAVQFGVQGMPVNLGGILGCKRDGKQQSGAIFK